MLEPPVLLDIPEAPLPPGGDASWIQGAGGARLRAALFTPPGRARGTVVLSGGRTEPIEKYYETISDFMDRGFVVLAHDWRGQGLSVRELSDRLKGHARGYKPFLEDFRRLLDAFETQAPRPWIAVGHSMGGCLTLLAMANGERRFAGAVLSAPMLGLKFGKVNPLVARALTRLSNAFGRAGRYTLGQSGKPFEETFEGNILTHDPVRYGRHRAQIAANPDLALGATTWGWLDFALRATDVLSRPERLRGVTVPVDIVSAEDDSLVDNAAQAAAARNLPQGRLITVPGAYHEILMETDAMRNIFLRVFDALTGKVAPKPAEAPKVAPLSAESPAEPPAVQPVAATVKPSGKAMAAAKKPVAAKARAPVAKAKVATSKAAPSKALPAKSPAGPKPAAASPAYVKPRTRGADAKLAMTAPASAKPAPVKKTPGKKAPLKKSAMPGAASPSPASKATSAKVAPSKKTATKPASAKKPRSTK